MNVAALTLTPTQSCCRFAHTRTRTKTHGACEHVHARTPTQTHACRLCVEVVHACLVESSYVERIFDLSQAANQLLHYLHLVSWVCWLLGPSPASDAGYRGSQREIPTHSCSCQCVSVCLRWCLCDFCACASLCCCRLRI